MSVPQDLPEHVADSGDWKDWPRKLEAHLKWGVRGRQVEGYVRAGKLRVWKCPDGTYRVEPDAMRELFGVPVEARDRDLPTAERKRKQAEAVELSADPVAAMFARSVTMLEESHQTQISLVKIIGDPMKELLNSYKDQLAAMAARIATLESQLDEARALQSELGDAKQERDLSVQRFAAEQKRKDETLQLLKDELPKLVATWLAGDSLSGWAKRAPRDVVEAFVESGGVAEQDADIMRRAAGIPKPAPQQQQQTE